MNKTAKKHGKISRLAALLLAAVLVLGLAACGGASNNTPANDSGNVTPSNDSGNTPGGDPQPAAPNGQIVVLYTSDVHCGIDQGFGYAGLAQVRKNLEAQGYATILVDNGDAIQGEAIGTLSKGEAIIKLMNEVGYDVAIPGNHEFDYGMPQFLKLAEMAKFQYISCNFNKEGELVFKPYTIIEAAGRKIGFVGVTTPESLTSSTPASFQDENGNYIYGFLEDENGQAVYDAVQKAVDAARADGAELVYCLGHLGLYGTYSPWSYEDVVRNTNGIDVFFDGHSHDSEQVVMKNKDGDDVIRSACGTKLSSIGYSFIGADGKVGDTNIWTWANKTSAPDLFGISNSVKAAVDAANAENSTLLGTVVAHTNVELTINDPIEKDSSGKPVRMVRRADTNLADLCADAVRSAGKADVALLNGGGVRVSIAKGDITYGNIISVFPFGNELCVIEATGQQILDALEWGAKDVPREFGGFLQVSGLSYSIDVKIPSPCVASEKSMLVGISGQRRVSDVKVGGEPIDPARTYTVAGLDYLLLSNGDGNTAFDGCKLLQDRVQIDNQVLINYIVDALGGQVGTGYEDPYGDGRIVVKQ